MGTRLANHMRVRIMKYQGAFPESIPELSTHGLPGHQEGCREKISLPFKERASDLWCAIHRSVSVPFSVRV